VCIAEHQINWVHGQEFAGCSDIRGELASEFPPVQPFGQGMSTLEILSDQQHVPPGECHLAASQRLRRLGRTHTVPRVSKLSLFKIEQSGALHSEKLSDECGKLTNPVWGHMCIRDFTR
jgi:hypothetical protein